MREKHRAFEKVLSCRRARPFRRYRTPVRCCTVLRVPRCRFRPVCTSKFARSSRSSQCGPHSRLREGPDRSVLGRRGPVARFLPRHALTRGSLDEPSVHREEHRWRRCSTTGLTGPHLIMRDSSSLRSCLLLLLVANAALVHASEASTVDL